MNLEKILMLSAGFTLAALAMGTVYAYNEYNRKPVSIRPGHAYTVGKCHALHAGWIKGERQCISRLAGEKITSTVRGAVHQHSAERRLCTGDPGNAGGNTAVTPSMGNDYCGMGIFHGSFLRVRSMLDCCNDGGLLESDLSLGEFFMLSE